MGMSTMESYNLEEMQPLKAQVRNGRLVVDEPTDLPEGQVIYLVPADEAYDQLDDEQLQRELEASVADMKAGRVVDADEVLAELEHEHADFVKQSAKA